MMPTNEQPHQHAEGDYEVCGAVKNVEEGDEWRVKEPTLDRCLVKEVEGRFEVDNSHRIVERMKRCVVAMEVCRTEPITHESVDHVDNRKHDCFT